MQSISITVWVNKYFNDDFTAFQTFLQCCKSSACQEMFSKYCICTTKEENMAMRSVLAKNQYKEIFEFNNLKTDNDIVFCAKSLSEYQNLVIENKAKRSVLVSIDTFEIK
jgi:hypothetical protein